MCARVRMELVVTYWFLILWVTSDWKSNVGTTVPTIFPQFALN